MDINSQSKIVIAGRREIEENIANELSRRKKINCEEKNWKKSKRKKDEDDKTKMKKDEDDKIKMKNTRQICARKEAIESLVSLIDGKRSRMEASVP